MKRYLSRVLLSLSAAIACATISSTAMAQITVTDGTARTGCTSFSVSYLAASPSTPTINLLPEGCLAGSTPPPTGPYFQFASGQTALISEADAATAGGAYNITFTVQLVRNGNTSPLSVTVEACRAGTNCTAHVVQDYYLEAGFSWTSPYAYTLNFGANETTKTFVIAVADNNVVDGSRALTFSLINPTSPAVVSSATGAGLHTLTIQDNEVAASSSVTFDTTAPAIFENTPLGYIGVSRSSGAGTASVAVQVQASSTAVYGTNYALDDTRTPFTGTPRSYTINFAAGETSKGFYVRPIDVTGYFGNKTAVFGFANLVNLTAGAAPTSTLTIYDKDPGDGIGLDGLPIADVTVNELYQNYCVSGLDRYPGGRGGPCGASPVDPSICGTGLPAGSITAAWQLNLLNPETFANTQVHLALNKNHAYTFKFRTPSQATIDSWPASKTLGPLRSMTTFGDDAPMFWSYSTARCDFNYSKLTSNPPDPCYSGGINASIYALMRRSSDPVNSGACNLAADTDYYFNMRWENPTLAPGVLGCTNTQCASVIAWY